MKQITNGAITYSIGDNDAVPNGYHEVTEEAKNAGKSDKKADSNKTAQKGGKEK